MKRHFPSLALAILVAVCSSQQPTPEPPPSAATTTTETDVAIAHAMADPARSAFDRAEDPWRQPATALDLLQAQPGMRVIDVFAVGGYYTDLLARIVGPAGKAIPYNNPPYVRLAGKQPAERFRNDRFPNVTMVTAKVPDLSLPANSLDATLFVLVYHDLDWRPADGGWERTDPATLLKTLHQALQPGGIVFVQDHAALPGSEPHVTADRLHRIDPERVKQDFAAAGFRLDAESDAFVHADDDLTKRVFDPPCATARTSSCFASTSGTTHGLAYETQSL